MKKLIKIIIGILAGTSLTFSSCDFLDVDRYFEATFKEDSIFHSQKNAEGYLWNTPGYFPDAGSIWGGSWNPGELASDELTVRWQTGEFWGAQFSIGQINERNLPITSLWSDMYRVIARCNKMLQNVSKVEDMGEIERRRYISYVHFMRGYAYYHLLMNWGPLLIVGDEVLPTSESAEYYNRERATYDESVDYICKEFQLATEAIYGPEQQNINFYTRPTKGAALALIARLRLFQASPLFNGGEAARRSFGNWKRQSDGAYYVSQTYNPTRWAVAAAAAKQVINLNYYELHRVEQDPKNPYPLAPNVSTAPFPNGAGGIDPIRSFADMFNGEAIPQTNKELIWTMPSLGVTSYTRHSFPVKFGGWGGMSVPQRVVDCFLMADGRTIHNASAEYPYEADLSQTIGSNKKLGEYLLKENVPQMYNNRSARFYASIGFPGRVWPMNSASSGGSDYVNRQFWYSRDDTDAGLAGAGNNINDYCISGYTPIKYIHPDDSFAEGKGGVKGSFITGPKHFPIIRYAEVLLEYIEALNNVEGTVTVQTPDASGVNTEVSVSRDLAEMSTYFNMIRYRVGLPGVSPGDMSDKATFEQIIRNERQVELFNEGYRYFDTRRWGTYLEEDANTSNWRGLDVQKDRTNANGNEGFFNLVSIDVQNIRDRVAKPRMVFMPLPHSELLKVPAMDQNYGWDR